MPDAAGDPPVIPLVLPPVTPEAAMPESVEPDTCRDVPEGRGET